MTDIELISREIDNLEELACRIEELGIKLIENAILNYEPDSLGFFPNNKWQTSSPELKIIQREAVRKYQQFYSAGLHYVREFIPEKENEFSQRYESKDNYEPEGVMDYLQFRRSQSTNQKNEIIERFIDRFEIQRSILTSIPYVAKIKEMNLREIISAAFVERDIEEAEDLFRKNHFRAAGALAGVALEQYLRTLCDKYQIEYNKKDTIEPLVQKLHKNKKIDITQMKKIQHLASIRDRCDHPSEIEKEEVRELLERVKKLT